MRIDYRVTTILSILNYSKDNNYEKESKNNNMDRWTHCGGYDLVGINILVFHKPTGQAYE